MNLIKLPDSKGGHFFLPDYCPKNILEMIANDFRTRDDDLFIESFAKSGTTWMQRVIWLLTHNGIEQDKKITDVMPWLEIGEGFNAVKNMDSPRFITSHLPYALSPGVNDSQAKYIYVARNPKDCVVSGYHFFSSLKVHSGSWDDYLESFMSGTGPFGDWFTHVLGWHEASLNSDNILFVKYEDMKQDLATVVTTMADFFSITLDPLLLQSVVERSGFKAMAKNSNINYQWEDEAPTMMRKGMVGDWQNHFTEEQSKAFDALYQERMKNTTLTFDFVQ